MKKNHFKLVFCLFVLLLSVSDAALCQSIGNEYILENQQVKAVVRMSDCSVTLTNKASAKVYMTSGLKFATTKAAAQANNQALIVEAEMQNQAKSPVQIGFSLEGKALRITIAGSAKLELPNGLDFPGMIANNADDFFIIPRGTGILSPVTAKPPFGNFTTYTWKSTMPFVGVTNLKDGYMVATDDQWDAEFRFEKPSGHENYSFRLHQKPAKNTLGYARTAFFVLVDNGYPEMCEWYRRHAESLGYVKTFRQKHAENPDIEKLIGAVDFWPIKMRIRPEFIDTVKLLGIDKAVWHLTGSWGKFNFSELIDKINSEGFLTGRYDIFTDVWPPEHPEWKSYRREGYPEDVIVQADGQLRKGWLAYPDNQPFQGYYTCAATHLAYAKKHIPEDLTTNHYNSRFIDVEMASSLEECYSDEHPVTRKQDAQARNAVMSYVKNELKLIAGVEEAHDYAFSNIDYSEGTMTIVPAKNAGYDWSNPIGKVEETYIRQNISPALRIPLHGLVYHDVHIPSWYTGDGASKVPDCWDDKNLWNILYASMPLYMPPSRKYWENNREQFVSGFHLVSAVTRNVGYARMTDHQFISADRNIQQTSFDNGWTVTANFDSIPREWNGKILAAKGFYASGKTGESFRLVLNNQPIGWSLTGNRLFFNPFSAEAAWGGVRSKKSVFMEKMDEFILLSFIGDQDFVDLKVDELPFKLRKITKVTDYLSEEPVNVETLAGGWKRIHRPEGKTFFRIYYR